MLRSLLVKLSCGLMDRKQQSKTTTFKRDKVIKYIPLSLYLSMLIHGLECGGEEGGGGGGGAVMA